MLCWPLLACWVHADCLAADMLTAQNRPARAAARSDEVRQQEQCRMLVCFYYCKSSRFFFCLKPTDARRLLLVGYYAVVCCCCAAAVSVRASGPCVLRWHVPSPQGEVSYDRRLDVDHYHHRYRRR